MAFGINRVELIGRLGADVVVNHLATGGRVANLSIATDESFVNRQNGEKVQKTEWHRVVTFQDGLIDMLERHAKKGRLVHAEGKLKTRRWKKDGEDSDRFSTEILVVPGHRLQFLDKPTGNGAHAGERRGRAGARRVQRDRRRRGPRRHRDTLLSQTLPLPTRAAASPAVAPLLQSNRSPHPPDVPAAGLVPNSPGAVRADRPKGGGAGGENGLSRLIHHCATLAQSANPFGVLHSAALRSGRDSE